MESQFEKIFYRFSQQTKKAKEEFEDNPQHSNLPHALVPCDSYISAIIETDKPAVQAISIEPVTFYDDNGNSLSQDYVDEYLEIKKTNQVIQNLYDAACRMSLNIDNVNCPEKLLLNLQSRNKEDNSNITDINTNAVFITRKPKSNSPYFIFENENLYYIYYDENNIMDKSIIANFSLEIIQQLIVYGKANTQGNRNTHSIYKINIQTTKGTFSASIEDSLLEKLTWITKGSHAKAQIEQGCGAKVRQYLQKLITKENYPKLYHYETNGWTRLDNGQLVYLTDKGAIGFDIPITGSSKNLFLYDKDMIEADAVLKYVNMLKITNNHTVPCILMLETLLGCMNTLFELAGYPNKKGIFILGQTQSMKTTLALMFTKVYDRNDLSSPTLSFSSTACGIEEKLSEISDAAIILDDLAPKLNKAEMSTLLNKLEQVIRAVGDRVVKHRMTAYSPDTKDAAYPVKSSVIITGEMLDGMQSSLARLIQLDLKRSDINTDLLTRYQQSPYIVSTALYHFINYITPNVQEVISYINITVTEKRDKYNNLYYTPRFQEYKAIYETVIDIFIDYISNLSIMDRNLMNNIKDEMYNIVHSVLLLNDENLKTETIPERIMEAIKNAVITGELCRYYPDNLNGFTQNGILILEDYYIIYPDTLLRILKTYFRNKDQNFYCNSIKGLSNILDGAHFILSKLEGEKKRFTHKLNKQICSSTTRYYYLHKKFFEER
ncbi:hypothetical protein ACOAOT_22220 [Lacrimispora sp. AGF001]|uniref:hypothetical protein n=1 Tax=Lacrimispora sp. AGF001 TaxID=3401631 RepID=UPI003B42B777